MADQPLKEREFGNWSLEIRDASTRADFANYIQINVRKSSSITYSVIGIAALLLLAVSFLAKDPEKSKIYLHFGVMLGAPVLASLPLILLSYRKETFIEAVQPVTSVTLLAVVILFNYVEILGDLAPILRYQQVYLMATQYFISTQFLSATYFRSLIWRYTINILAVVVVMIKIKQNSVPNIDFTQLVAIQVLLNTAMEISLYQNMKDKVELFLRFKASEKQQNSLTELLDAVPDCVYICTKPGEENVPRGLYANLKMDQFFGRSVLVR